MISMSRVALKETNEREICLPDNMSDSLTMFFLYEILL